jgi:predicted phosphodiesterase
MRIAVISDTHDHLPEGLAERFATADEIWHLGDVVRRPRWLNWRRCAVHCGLCRATAMTTLGR